MNQWRFLDEWGTFELDEPQQTSYLYFPLVNEARMMASITPTLHGDLKSDQHHFLLAPVSLEDLHHSRSGRNFWVYVEGHGAWSAAGASAAQIARQPGSDETTALTAGPLWHRLTRQSETMGLRAELTSFVPPSDDRVELLKVTLTNISSQPLTLTPTAAIPLYGRSADNLRDHRHVTALLHRIRTSEYGVTVCPTLSFDERGHTPNSTAYSALGAEGDGTPPEGFFPTLAEFVGEGGCLDWPRAVVENLPVVYAAGSEREGCEAMGGLRFRQVTLPPGGSQAYIVILAITGRGGDPAALTARYGSAALFDDWFQRNTRHWQKKQMALDFRTGERSFDMWLKWVALQPVLRRLYGNSFLPAHDYGRGGRGWRDLWQDCLALLMMEPESVGGLLFDYFAGVRLDGTNATIIGARPGEFAADRNNIARVWMDHGAWPYLTTRLYIDQSGDLAFLLHQQAYFKDQHICRARQVDESWQPEQGTQLRTASGEIYRGSILEHLLVQHLVAFFNVGAHNNMLLENADWNDGLDMAPSRGESVAFTALYASNLLDLSQLLLELEKRVAPEVDLAVELLPLLDTLSAPVDYALPEAKQARLAAYFSAGQQKASGETARIGLRSLSDDLKAKADWLYAHLRADEWLQDRDGFGWFNGYYDDDGQRVEGDHPNGVRMTLTGQVFTLMGAVATDEQAGQIVRAADRYLYDAETGGYRLNTSFGEMPHNLGRCFGYAYGHKENGAMFSHMHVMYANALYQRGFVREGYRALHGLYCHCQDFPLARIYPGLPEYVEPGGRGLYTYLTGSASWYLLTLLTQVFGVRGVHGQPGARSETGG